MINLSGIARKKTSYAPMEELQTATISRESGLTGDFRGRPGKRQITILSYDDWQQACAELRTVLPWTTRRANLLLSGLQFSPADVGKVLRIGDVRLQITRETDPCQRMEEAHAGLKTALTPSWRGGVCCRVLSGGQISINDIVSIS